ncbi:MAG: PQQ-dependent sugar dehydrogenase [Mariniphaga sp.]|nr:PQQ-dependent sugar dehydrogenase [Mariniphaga sp.]
MKAKFLPGIFFFLVYIPLSAQLQLDFRSFATDLDNPVDIVNAGDDRLFVVQQRGLIRILDLEGNVSGTPFLDLSGVVSQSGSETGLLGLTFHPEYHENGYFFVNYTRASDGSTVVSRFSTDTNNPDLANRESEIQILTVDQPYLNHNGGQLLFGPDGYLYIALGDGGSGGDPNNYAQNRSTFLGKMLRIDVDVEDETGYGIPPDNPFVDDETALDEIWAWGLRNPWRNSFDRMTGDFWIADVGQNSREEINFQSAGSSGGENYGWRCYEGNQPYNQSDCPETENYVFPVFEYNHEGSGCSGSVTGGYVYRGALFNELFGVYIFADYCTGNIYTISQNSTGFEGEQLSDFNERGISTFGEDRYGELYFAKKKAGEIYKLTETGDCKPVAKILANDSTYTLEPGNSIRVEALYNPALQYEWRKNDEPVAGGNQFELEITEEGVYTVQVTNPKNGCTNISAPVEVTTVPTSVAVKALEHVKVFPNPVKNMLFIEGLPVTGKTSVSLVDTKGSVVKTLDVSERSSIRISTNELTSGIYFLKILNEAELFQEKIIVPEF